VFSHLLSAVNAVLVTSHISLVKEELHHYLPLNISTGLDWMYLQGSYQNLQILNRILTRLIHSPINMVATCSSKMSIYCQLTGRPHVLEHRRLHSHLCKNRKSYSLNLVFNLTDVNEASFSCFLNTSQH
jgi:hypothetical protein